MSIEDLSPDARKILEAMTKASGGSAKTRSAQYASSLEQYHKRRLKLTTMWLLGASYRQLAAMESVSAQSIYQSIDKTMDVEQRNKNRILIRLTHTAFSWYWERYDEVISNDEKYASYPTLAANHLYNNHPFSGD